MFNRKLAASGRIVRGTAITFRYVKGEELTVRTGRVESVSISKGRSSVKGNAGQRAPIIKVLIDGIVKSFRLDGMFDVLAM